MEEEEQAGGEEGRLERWGDTNPGSSLCHKAKCASFFVLDELECGLLASIVGKLQRHTFSLVGLGLDHHGRNDRNNRPSDK